MSKEAYNKSFYDTDLISKRIKNNKPKLVIDLKKEAEENEKNFKKAIDEDSTESIALIFSEFALS